MCFKNKGKQTNRIHSRMFQKKYSRKFFRLKRSDKKETSVFRNEERTNNCVNVKVYFFCLKFTKTYMTLLKKSYNIV